LRVTRDEWKEASPPALYRNNPIQKFIFSFVDEKTPALRQPADMEGAEGWPYSLKNILSGMR